MSTKRCAIYTRKSSEEGLEQDFNSLHAQREACEAFIISQKHEGWQLIKTAYDDGGFSGGNMERPALKQLLVDIGIGKIDVIVVYKVDRLSRSLHDFARMVDVFDKHNVSFVSVTQQFNTTTSMGRLTLNVLLSFAQFEREVTSERIRDKFAASKRKGIWMGGPVPLGYRVEERKLLIVPADAQTVRLIYQRYLETHCVRLLLEDLKASCIRSKANYVLSRGTLYKMLSNPIYIGKISHKGICYQGQHEAIIDQELWDAVQQGITGNRIGNKAHSRKTDPSPLAGKLFDTSGERLVPIHANKKGRRYRYYISQSLMNNPKDVAMSGWRLPGQETEQVIAQATFSVLQDRGAIATALQDAWVASQHLPAALKTATDAEKSTIIERFVDRIELNPEGIRLTLSLAALVPAQDNPVKITRDIPVQMKRRGVEMRLVIGNSSPARIDPALINGIIKARAWFNELVSGHVKTLTQIASRDGIDLGTLSRMLNLAFLAPDIIEAILVGQHPADLTVEKLTKKIELPMDWEEQKRLLGCA